MSNQSDAKNKIDAFHKALSDEALNPDLINTKQYNYEFDVRNSSEKLKVLVYFGKKGVRTVIQGNEENGLYKKVKSIVFDEMEFDFPLRLIDEPESYIGSDESGKGDIFGPLVTAAVHVDATTKEQLERIGVRDSKELSDYQITEIAYLIEKTIGENCEIILITPAKYNELYEKFKNLNKLLNWSHSKAVENLLARTNCRTVITDKFEKKNLTIAGTGKGMNVNFIQTPKAERYTAVAAASILARNAFNKWFISKRKEGYDLPKGASDQVALKAKQIFNNNGDEILKTIAKMHFKTIKKIKLQ